MSGKFLLDTNIIIALFAEEPAVQDKFDQAVEVFLSNTAIGELYFGAYKSKRVDQNIKRIKEFVEDNTVLNCDKETAQHYGKIKRELKAKGKPIPENDIWIAAIALQYSLTLVTRDDHFKEIDNLLVEQW